MLDHSPGQLCLGLAVHFFFAEQFESCHTDPKFGQ